MMEKRNGMSRRAFLQTAGAAGLGSVVGAAGGVPPVRAAGGSSSGPAQVPTRPFGKTGREVSVLSLGGVLDSSDLLVFRQAFKWGVTYWDTADSYGGGRNETAIGEYFAKFPNDREKIFLVTKAATSNPKKLTVKLNTSLERMKTDHVDLFFIHYVSSVEKELTPAVRQWAERAKADGKIKLFGFSTHKKMEACMLAAAELGWIDGIMMSYNYRLMVKREMKRAVAACARAGIGLTAMKTQAAFTANFYASIGSNTDQALQLTEKVMEKGYTTEQARLRVVWENPAIASICSAMPNMTILQANVAAALNRNALSHGDRQRLERYAHRTAPGYCTGCAGICEAAVDGDLPIADILRFCMYDAGYGDRSRAARHFRALPARIREDILRTDFRSAEKKCPQGVPIGKILRAARRELDA